VRALAAQREVGSTVRLCKGREVESFGGCCSRKDGTAAVPFVWLCSSDPHWESADEESHYSRCQRYQRDHAITVKKQSCNCEYEGTESAEKPCISGHLRN
jgi:hypothetical protein